MIGNRFYVYEHGSVPSICVFKEKQPAYMMIGYDLHECISVEKDIDDYIYKIQHNLDVEIKKSAFKDEQIRILEEALKFYADIQSYHTNYHKVLTRDSEANMIIYDDLELITAEDNSYEKRIGGKRARSALKQTKEMRGEK